MDDFVPVRTTQADLPSLGAFVRERRQSLGLTQVQLGVLVGWQQERVSLLESGRYGLPSVSALAVLAVALQTTLADVLAATGFGDDLDNTLDRGNGHHDEPIPARCIAVVDDDESLLDLMRDILREREWQLLAVRDASIAFATLRDRKPDVVVLDVRLGNGADGWSVFGQLQADPDTRDLPIIMWSADTHDLDGKRDWLAEQGILVFDKPFDTHHFLASVDATLLRKRTATMQTDSQGGTKPPD